VQFERRTEASGMTTNRASSDPTVMKPGNAGGAKGPDDLADGMGQPAMGGACA
jgi:hypothetical protein